jgi:hypothetical protein
MNNANSKNNINNGYINGNKLQNYNRIIKCAQERKYEMIKKASEIMKRNTHPETKGIKNSSTSASSSLIKSKK